MLPSYAENQQLGNGRPLDARSFVESRRVPGQPSVLLATTDSEIRRCLIELLQPYPVSIISASCMEEIKSAVAHHDIMACFCGFWLVDGTYRDVVGHLKRQRAGIPVVIVCAPTCPQEYRDYLAALNIRALDFICYPYRRADLERILNSALTLRSRRQAPQPAAVPSSDRLVGSSGLRRAS